MKHLFLFLTILALCIILVSCGDTENPPIPEDKVEETGNSGDPAFDNVTPDAEFEYPDDPAKFVVNYIRSMAMRQWTPNETFHLYGKYQAWSYNLTYEAGTKYYGPPFLTYSRGTKQEFENSLVDGVYMGGTTDADAIGSACYDAVYVSLIQVCPSINFESTEDMLPANETGLLPVGDWDWSVSKHDTRTIMQAHTITQMTKAYAELKPGDVVLKHLVSQDAGHTRIVSGGPVVYKNSDGSINFTTSYITALEQTNAWDKKVSHNTTWYVDHVYTFKQLYDTFFVPLRPADYDKDVSRAYVTVSDFTKAEELQKGRKLEGIVESNHYVTELKITITNDEGKIIYEKNYFPNSKKIYLEDLEYKPGLYNYDNGKYNFKLDASLAFGTKTLVDCNFVLD